MRVTLDKMSPLEFLRRNAGLTQREIEKAVGLPAGTMTRIERDYVKPSLAVRQALARYFRLNEYDLFPKIADEELIEGIERGSSS